MEAGELEQQSHSGADSLQPGEDAVRPGAGQKRRSSRRREEESQNHRFQSGANQENLGSVHLEELDEEVVGGEEEAADDGEEPADRHVVVVARLPGGHHHGAVAGACDVLSILGLCEYRQGVGPPKAVCG